jgi:hypothetical protein
LHRASRDVRVVEGKFRFSNPPLSALISNLRARFNLSPRFVRDASDFSQAIQAQSKPRSAYLTHYHCQTAGVIEIRGS